MTETKPENPAALKILSEADLLKIEEYMLLPGEGPKDLDYRYMRNLISTVRALREGLEESADCIHGEFCSTGHHSECIKAHKLLGGSDERS